MAKRSEKEILEEAQELPLVHRLWWMLDEVCESRDHWRQILVSVTTDNEEDTGMTFSYKRTLCRSVMEAYEIAEHGIRTAIGALGFAHSFAATAEGVQDIYRAANGAGQDGANGAGQDPKENDNEI